MFARNLLILAIFSPSAVLSAAVPLLAMTICALVVVQRARTRAGDSTAEIHLQSPVSIAHVLSFAVLFLVIQIVSELGQRHLGRLGFLGISVLGGCVSSASTSAAAAKMVAHGQIDPSAAGTGVVLTSFASALINLPIIYRRAKNPRLFRRVTVFTISLILIGIAALAVTHLHRALNFF